MLATSNPKLFKASKTERGRPSPNAEPFGFWLSDIPPVACTSIVFQTQFSSSPKGSYSLPTYPPFDQRPQVAPLVSSPTLPSLTKQILQRILSLTKGT